MRLFLEINLHVFRSEKGLGWETYLFCTTLFCCEYFEKNVIILVTYSIRKY